MDATPIRNIAIIAHVDHGKTTLVDQLLRKSGSFRANQVIAERAMDSMDLEREKGITIKAKNTSVHWKEAIINIVDTPGHADFGAEVERVMRMVDGVLLVVDAYEGPQAQTRFVLRKALQEGLHPIVVINKIDRENSDPARVHDLVLELFLELEASETQFNAPFLYGSARDGYMSLSPQGPHDSMDPLFEAILRHIPAPRIGEGPFRMLVSNIDWNDYVGRVALGKIHSGEIRTGQTVHALREGLPLRTAKITKIFEYSALATQDTASGFAGHIVGIAGFEELDIGDTLSADPEAAPLPFVAIDPPTIRMQFAVNDGPLAGREGKLVTSRQIRDRLFREMKSNISIHVTDTATAGVFDVSARGAMQIAVLVEQMRREGYEVLVSRPTVITRQEGGTVLEPFETLYVDVPEDCLGSVMKSITARRGRIERVDTHRSTATVEATIPTRGLIGYETELVNATSGRGVMSHLFKEYQPHCGEITTRSTGTLVSIEQGETKAYALDALESRGRLFVSAGEEVYEGMIIGENPRQEDLPVNPTKAKQLTNFRSQGEGKGIQLSPKLVFSLERAIEYIAGDEYVEATPKSIRLRKRILDSHTRRRLAKAAANV
ncbi:MAG: translational GTPase TypA [Puniceicoccaceae bacterium]|nr:MAG: translational GTPase TypA [Puniceicoccaceae bacterium]